MRCLFIGAHPDDLEFGCAGTARKIVQKGGEALFLVMTNGELGGDKSTRQGEQTASCELLGVQYENVGLPDLGVKDSFAPFCKVFSYALDFMPDYIFVHAPRDKHPDHRATTMLAERVAKELRIPILYYRSFSTLEFKPHITFVHSRADDKRAALHCHKSQIDKYNSRGIDFVGLAMPNENEESYELWRYENED